jgi:amino acid adenylation domain-containing protein
MNKYNGTDIAIIGMAGRFPGANNIEDFWDNLKNGVESISFFSEQELMDAGVERKIIDNPLYVRANSFLQDKEYFDSAFFERRPEEASITDPQIRIFQECVWHAMEDTGYNIYQFDGKIGLFAGARSNVNWMNYVSLINQGKVDDFTSGLLSNVEFICSGTSYLFNLKGPSIYLNTACSTSLVAIQKASMSLLLQECNIAIAGGASIGNYSKRGYLYEEGMIYSRDGHCRSFDANASGTIGGEGIGVVVLKRLKEAIDDGDNIHAIIKGSSINNDGSTKVGFTAPSIEGQREVILKARKMANIEPESIGFIEAHGTGTPLGDPIEVAALSLAFGKSEKPYCALGSVKSNIGHLDVAAGVTGFIKAVLALKNKQIPGTLHYEKPNANISFKDSPFYVNKELKEWKNEKYPLRAGVTSLGIGGTNVHVILEEAPDREASSAGRAYQLLTLSGKTSGALARNGENLKAYLERNPDVKLADVAYTLNACRTSFDHRKSLVCKDTADAIAQLGSLRRDEKSGCGTAKQSIAFLFPGQGSQHTKMCSDLFVHERVFREEATRCFELVERYSGKDMRGVLFSADATQLNETAFTQPALFIVEYSLSRLLMSWGIQPDIMLGHSIGEYVAACLSGVFTLEDALKLVVMRGELMQQMETGGMLSILISEELLAPYLEKYTGISLAAVNSASSCVVSGPSGVIGEFQALLEGAGFSCKRLTTSHAFHSQMMDGMLADFGLAVAAVKISPQQLPFISNVTGKRATDEELCQPGYWTSQLRNTVRFSDGISSIMTGEQVLFIEVGPGKALGSFVGGNTLKRSGHKIINLLGSAQAESDALSPVLLGLGKLWQYGAAADWKGFYADEVRHRISLPGYSFEKTPYPVDVDARALISGMISDKRSLRKGISEWFYAPTWKLSSGISGRTISNGGLCTLVFTDQFGIAEGIVERLRQKNGQVVCVRPGSGFKEESPDSYVLSPGDEKHYRQLFTNLTAHHFLPDRIVHCWCITGAAWGEEFLSDSTDLYFYSLVNAVKSSQGHKSSLREVTVLSSGLHDIFGEADLSATTKSMCVGLLKVIGQEYPTIATGHIDISLAEHTDSSFSSRLFNEVMQPHPGKVVSYRNSCRWEQIHEKVQMEKELSFSGFKSGGVYLITGGLGGFGYAISKYLSKHYQAKLVLLGRSALPAKDQWEHWLDAENGDKSTTEKIESIRSIESEGGEVLYFDCDISGKERLSEVVELSEKHFGTLNGVFHAAGIVNGRSMNSIDELERSDFESQFSAKLNGLRVLHEVLNDRELDFCVLTSSLASILGGLGFGAYSSANIFMDYFVQSRKKHGLLKNWVSINFDGLNFDDRASEEINYQELPDLMSHALSLLGLPQLVVSTKELQPRLDDWIGKRNLFTNDEGEAVLSGVEIGDFREDGLSPEEGKLMRLWVNFFGKSDFGIDDNFFEIGGDSLKALTLIARINKELNVNVSLSTFFEKASIRSLAAHLSEIINADISRAEHVPLKPAAKKDYYELSPPQRRLYFLYEMDKSSLAYNMPQAVKLEGEFDKERLSSAFIALISRQESFRTCFQEIEGEMRQKLEDNVKLDIDQIELNGTDVDVHIQKFIRPFDLSQAPLLRVGLIRISESSHILLVDMHHIISDGVSQGILIQDFMALYNKEELPQLRLQYKDYSEWQQSAEQQERLAAQRDFWKQEFSEEVPVLDLPADYARPVVKSYAGSSSSFSLSTEETGKLRALGAEAGATMFMTVLSVLNVLLSKLSNQEDITIGTPVAGRDHADLEGIMGMFVGTLALRNYPKGELSFREFLSAVKSKALSCFDNQQYPYEELIGELQLARDTSRNPLFDVMFVFQNFDQEDLRIPGLTLRSYQIPHRVSKFDLSLSASELNDVLHLNIEYSTDLFEKQTIERFISYFRRIVTAVTGDVTQKLSRIDILSEEEKNQLLYGFNDTAVDYPLNKTFIDIFEDQVEKTPFSIAAVDQVQELNYSDLNAQANQLAHTLLLKGLVPEIPVMVLCNRSVGMLTGLIGILKAGGAYVPLSAEFPIYRIVEAFSDTRSPFLLTTYSILNEELLNALHLAVPGLHIICLDDLNNKKKSGNNFHKKLSIGVSNASLDGLNFTSRSEWRKLPDDNPSIGIQPDNLAYILYTSGSTGVPKGVMIEHKGMLNHLLVKRDDLKLNSLSVISQSASETFDISIWQFLSALVAGGKTVVYSKDCILEPKKFLDQISKDAITILEVVPSYLSVLLGHLEDRIAGDAFLKLEYLLLTGEVLHRSLVKRWFDLYPGIKIINAYGPTEASDDITHCILEEVPISNIVSIGKVLPNLKIYIVDEHMNLCAKGVTGEIVVSGVGVGRGYLNQPEKTLSVFVTDPFSIEEVRMYRTGDLGRWLPDGNIEFLGRKDNQVKINGHRIELGEIENRLDSHQEIKDVVVLAKEQSGDNYLVGYYVSEVELPVSDLREHLSAHLPDYMIPSYFVHMEGLPLTVNGKIDRKALPNPEFSVGANYVAPSGELEEKLLEIWSDVLKLDKELISVTASFFEIGGHSLKATTLVNKISKELNVEVPLREIFINQTIRYLAVFIAGSAKLLYTTIAPATERTFYPLSSVQRRLYFIYEFDKTSVAYNMTNVVELEGGLDKDSVESTFRKLIERHESLRTCIVTVNEEPVQKVLATAEATFSIEYTESADPEATIAAFIRPFDLSHGPLIRVGLIKISAESHLLLVDMHHIIGDGVSMGILTRDFMSLYNKEPLAELPLQYKDYSEWQQGAQQQARLAGQREFWIQQFSEPVSVLDLPADFARPLVKGDRGDNSSFILKEQELVKLQELCQERCVTMFMAILSVYTILLSKLSGHEDITVGISLAGRDHADVEGIVGAFVNTLPIRNEIEQDLSFNSLLRKVQEKSLACFENQSYHYEDLIRDLNIPRDTSHNPLFDVLFAFHNFEREELLIPGLKLKSYKSDHKLSRFDLTLTAIEIKDGLYLNFNYATDLFKKQTIERFISYFERIISSVTANPDQRLSEINILSKQERDELVYGFNTTQVAYPKGACLGNLFSVQAKQTPDHTAVVYDGLKLSYRELDKQSNSLASELQALGSLSKVAAIYMEPSPEMIISILGVLKSGMAFLPLDPHHQSSRYEELLRDTSCDILITHMSLEDRLSFTGRKVVLSEEILHHQSAPEAVIKAEDGNLAYVIYTSGSTGKPKGVKITHDNLLNYIIWFKAFTQLTDQDKTILTSSFAFDLGYTSIFPILFTGGELHLVPRGLYVSPDELLTYISSNEITYLKITPSLFTTFTVSGNFSDRNLSSLRYVVSGGELIKTDDLQKAMSCCQGIRFINHYGPTETTIGAIAQHIEPDCFADFVDRPTIGRPINNMHCYLIGKNDELVPVGCTGELCISGAGVGQGYFGDLELTEAKFSADPYRDGERMYRTGDLARWLPDGNMEFLGRIDEQVKIRGYRIELGEIEHHLASHPGIEASVVVAREKDGSKYLVGYYVSAEALPATELRSFLAGKLPDYMVPVHYINLKALPLTSNGKIDRRKLPDADFGSSEAYFAPGNEVEEKLVAIWSEVLKLDKGLISIQSSFFALGGHSLKLIFMANKLKKIFKAQFSLAQLIELGNISKLGKAIQEAEASEYYGLKKAGLKPYYHLSSAQERLYFLYELDGTSLAYNMPRVVELEGPLDKDKVEDTFRKLIDRHESLRTSIVTIDEGAVQRILAPAEVTFSLEYSESDEAGAQVIIEAFIRPFDLGEGPLMRVGLIRLSELSHILLVDMHHIISDGVSQGILIRDFMALYNEEPLVELSLQYKDYSEWQQDVAQQERLAAQRAFWKAEFSEEVPVLDLPADHVRPVVKDYEGSSISFSLDKEETGKLGTLGAEAGATMFMTVLSVFNVLLSKLSNQEDITIGTPVAGRDHADLEGIMGMFVGTLALRNYPKRELSFREFLSAVKSKALSCFDNQQYPYEELIGELQLARDTGRNPLFDVMFVFQNFDREELIIPGLSLRNYQTPHRVSKFDLSLSAWEEDEVLHLNIEYSTDLFEEQTIERFISYFRRIVTAVTEDASQQLSRIGILPEDERKKLLYDFNDNAVVYPADKTLIDLFEEQVEKTPGQCALYSSSSTITYADLNRSVNQLTGLLRGRGLKNGDVVGILMDRSVEFVISVFAVLKAGALYLPVDAGYPEDRINYMLEDSKAVMLLTKADILAGKQIKGSCLSFCYEALQPELMSQADCNPERQQAEQINVIYTSGSTGMPKGVIGSGEGLLNRLFWGWETYPVKMDEVFCLKTNIGFVDHVAELFSPLLSGVPLRVISDEELLDMQAMYALLLREKITRITVVPSYLKALIAQGREEDLPEHSLKYVFCSGEYLPFELAKDFYSEFSEVLLVNIYGSTEVSADATYYHVDREYVQDVVKKNGRPVLPIGKPISNTTAFIVNSSNQHQPIGVIGELWIGGMGLAHGYINHQELTDEKFITEAGSGDNFYRTGDLARWLPDGNIEYLGRIDLQTKIRGIRVELGEIERWLVAYAGVKNAVVAVFEKHDNKSLVAYYETKEEISAAELRNHLSGHLPDYMLPVQYIRLESIPMTSSGKVNRKALPDPVFTATSDYVAPSSKTESTLVKIWSEVLKLDEEVISVNANFFELGGHSIRAILLTNKIQRVFSVQVELRNIFEKSTISGLALLIENSRPDNKIVIPKVEKRAYYITSPAQERMYYGYLLDPDNLVRNISRAVELDDDMDIDRLEKAFQSLVKRHSGLRTYFELTEEGVIQKIIPTVNFKLHVTNLNGDQTLNDLFEDFIKPFDLSIAPLLRGMVVNSNNKNYLFIDIHHIVCDGMSMNVLIRDLKDLYFGRKLSELKLEYIDFSEWVRNGIDQEVNRAYWSKKLSGELLPLNLPVLQDRGLIQSNSYSGMTFLLQNDLHKKVKSFSAEAGVSDFIFFLSVYYIMLNKITGDRDIIIGSDVLGRSSKSLEEIVGTFINILPLRVTVNGEIDYSEFLERVKEVVLEAFEHQEYPFDKIVSMINSDDKLVDVHFAFGNTVDSREELEELKFKSIQGNKNKLVEYESIKLVNRRESEYNLQIEVHQNAEFFQVLFIYNDSLYDEGIVRILVNAYKNILSTVINSRNIKIDEIDVESSEYLTPSHGK